MTRFKGRRAKQKASGDVESPVPVPASEKIANGAHAPSSGQTEAIPDHVWRVLQSSGEEAARRLYELLSSPRFASYAPSAQARLIELGLTRAYGLPVRRSIDLKLSSDDADAVAQSLLDLGASLPERQSMIDLTANANGSQQND